MHKLDKYIGTKQTSQLNTKRNEEWYKILRPGDFYYDVSNLTIRKMTYIGYYVDQREDTWIVHSGGISKLNHRMYSYLDYHIMIKYMRSIEQIKLGNEIKLLNAKLANAKKQLSDSCDYTKFMKTTEEVDFTTEQPVIPEYAMELASNGIETNLK